MRSALYRRISSIRRRLPWLRGPDWQEVVLALAALFLLSCTYLLMRLASLVHHGDTQAFDERILLSLRRPDDPAVPVGPPWLREAGLDATSLGSPLVLVLIVVAVAVFMLLQRRRRVMLLTLLTTSGGMLVSLFLKHLMDRQRPTVVPHLRNVDSPSFPSGHAMLSAVVYLTLGILLVEIVPGRLTKLYCFVAALSLTFLVGVSRVYLGVHYPTDVLAGWMAGLVWALGCWGVFHVLERRGAVEKASSN